MLPAVVTDFCAGSVAGAPPAFDEPPPPQAARIDAAIKQANIRMRNIASQQLKRNYRLNGAVIWIALIVANANGLGEPNSYR
jgi:hypothetical protein